MRSASVAELQAERERLRAEQARGDYEKALAATRSRQMVASAGAALRTMLTQGLAQLEELMLNEAGKEVDETRVHQAMSIAAHDWLGKFGALVAQTLPDEVAAPLKRGSKPRDLLGVSEWSDRHREIKSGSNAPGRWRTDYTPYLREIMDALSEHSPVRQVTFVKSSGVGGSEAALNWIGYIMHHLGNKDLLVVQPTLELRDRSFNPRLLKMLEESPVLNGLISTASRNKANRGDLIEYGARARIIKAGANSPDSLRSDHLPYVLCDEVDAFPWNVGGEGDPMTLIENRQRTFTRAKTYLISTPTKTGASRISQQYARSDQRRYHVPCPHCGEYQPLEFGGKSASHGLKWSHPLGSTEGSDAAVARAWYVCRECSAIIEEADKTDMLAKGRWIAARPQIKQHRGYHINALYAPVGLGLGWVQIAQKWEDAQNDSAELIAFHNTYLGETWQDQGDSIEDISLLARVEHYSREDLKPQLISAGIDVQKNRIEVSLVAWGEREEGWLLDHAILEGDTAQPEVWAQLNEYLADSRVQIACIDAGFNTSMVYAFCQSRQWVVPIKGIPGMGRPLIEDAQKRAQRLRRRNKLGHAPEPLGVDQGKILIYARLKQSTPGPGYLHFPADVAFDDEYFAQLAAEKLISRARGGRQYQEWIKLRPRNEALDCLLYALAACRLAQSRAVAVAPEKGSAPAARPTRRIISNYVR